MNIAVVMAGGQGTRMKMAIPKQFIQLKGKPMLSYSLIAFEKHKKIDKIFIVCSEESRKTVGKIIYEEKIEKFESYVTPGETRRLSSKNAVHMVYEKYGRGHILLIHDAARPGITERIISDNIKSAEENGACCTAITVRDTMCKKDGIYLGDTVERENTIQLQTPQTFETGLIEDSHNFYSEKLESGKSVPEITDDTGLVRFYGHKIAIVEGSASNIKVTEQGDINFFTGNILEKDKND